MIKEYLSSLEKCYGYTGNWQPNCPIAVGKWADVELGILPWLKELLGTGCKSREINKNLHSIMSGSLEGLRIKQEKRASITLSHNVSMDISESSNTVCISAQKKGGFFALLQDVQEEIAESASFKEQLQQLDKTSVAVVAGITRAKKGILIVFNKKAASLSLEGGMIQEALSGKLALSSTEFRISSECQGIAVFQAEPSRPLIPFVKIYIAERETQSGFDGRKVHLDENYEIMPFSYADLFQQQGSAMK